MGRGESKYPKIVVGINCAADQRDVTKMFLFVKPGFSRGRIESVAIAPLTLLVQETLALSLITTVVRSWITMLLVVKGIALYPKYSIRLLVGKISTLKSGVRKF